MLWKTTSNRVFLVAAVLGIPDVRGYSDTGVGHSGDPRDTLCILGVCGYSDTGG